MKKRLLALLLAVVLCIGLLPTAALAAQTDVTITWFDTADAKTGKVTKLDGYTIGCERITSETTTLANYSYVVDQDVTINGDLTIGGNSMIRLFLCGGATLTVNGSLILTNNQLSIYGQTGSNGVGKLIVNNSINAGAAVRNDGGSQLSIYGGSMELHGGTNGQITDDKATLVSSNNIIKGTLDGEAVTSDKWDGVQSLTGSTLVLEYCRHTDNDLLDYKYDGNDKHHLHCKVCGLDYGSEDCNFEGGDTINAGADGHYRTCWCGNKESTPTAHTPVSVPTSDGKKHTSGCQYCGYTSDDSGESHSWDRTTGECTVCGFQPVATDDQNALYGSVDEALNSGSDKIYLFSQKTALDPINKSVTFNAPGKTVTLDMNSYTLKSSNTVLTVEAGTLILTGADGINIVQYGTNETAAPAIEVTGGKLIVNGDLTAEGGFSGGGIRQPAIKATGGELELNGNLNLKGGLTLKEPAKLNTPLTKGVFWAENSETLTYRIDLRGNKASKPANHPDLESILETGYVFVTSSEDGTPITDTDGNYTFYPPATNFVGANVTIVAHEHSYHQLTNDVAKSIHACDCGKSEDHTFENGVCTVCKYACVHDDVHQEEDKTFQCARCKMTMVAKSEKDGKTTHYSNLSTALEYTETGSTITLLADTTFRGANVYGDSTTRKELTLDMNGHSISSGAFSFTIGEKYIPYPGNNEYYPATLKIIGKGDLDSPITISSNSTLDLSEWTGTTIKYVGVSYENGTFIGPASATATINQLWLNSWGYGKQGTLRLSGGIIGMAYSNSFDSDNRPTYPYGSFLLPGYAFKQNGAYLKYTDVLPYREEVYNLSVVNCPHGALSTDANGTLRCGYCNEDMSVFAVEFTDKDGNTGYTSDPSDNVLNDKNVVKVKLLKDCNGVGDDITVNHAMTVDLNGKTIRGLTVEAAGVQIIDSAETKGSIGTLKVTADGVTLRDLLESGYGFKSADGTWVAEGAVTASNVSIAEAPIKEVYFYDGSYDNRVTELTKTYGEEAMLCAHWSPDTLPTVTQKWEIFDSKSGTWTQLEQSGTSYELSKFDYAGTYTYRFTATYDGYSKSADITVTVEPADIARAEVGLSGQGKVMFCPDANTGEGTDVTMQVVDVSFQNRGQDESEYTVSDNTGKNVGDYTLTITASPTSKKFTGSKTVSWKITPFKLGAAFFTGGTFEKDYDGTTTPPTGYFERRFDSNYSETYYGADIILTEGTHFTCTANLVDANVGDSKRINFSVTLKSPNYVFTSSLNDVENYTVSEDGKTLTYTDYLRPGTNLNVKPIDVPNFDKTAAVTVVNDLAGEYEVTLPSLPALTAPRDYGTITYVVESTHLTNGYESAAAQIVQDGEQYKLRLTVPAVQFDREESVGTITVKVTTANYNPVTLTVTVNANNKPQPTVNASADPNPFTYGTKLGDVALTATATYNGQTVEGTIAWDNPAGTILNKGSHEVAWTFTPTAGDTYSVVTGTLDLQVTAAALTGAPVFGEITTSGKTLNDVLIDFSGIFGVDGKQPVLGFDWTDDHSTVIEANKSYSWTIDAGSNYELLTGSTVLYPYSSGYSDQVKRQSEEFEAKKRGELPESDSTFTDVDENDYFFDAVEWAAANGITGGVSANRFGPNLDCSRGQTMTFLWRAMGEPDPDSLQTSLTDVKPGSYYYEAVLWAMEEGVTTGMGKDLFAPDATVTRGQFVTFLYRLSGAKNDAAHPFTDVPAGSYYEPAIAWAYSKGITTGTSKTTFNPDSPCTRAQIITFLYRYFNQK